MNVETAKRLRKVIIDTAERQSAFVAMSNLARREIDDGNENAASIRLLLAKIAERLASDEALEADIAKLIETVPEADRLWEASATADEIVESLEQFIEDAEGVTAIQSSGIRRLNADSTKEQIDQFFRDREADI